MVDTSLHVLDKNGNPSSNPYAADEVANAVYGDGSARAPMKHFCPLIHDLHAFRSDGKTYAEEYLCAEAIDINRTLNVGFAISNDRTMLSGYH